MPSPFAAFLNLWRCPRARQRRASCHGRSRPGPSALLALRALEDRLVPDAAVLAWARQFDTISATPPTNGVAADRSGNAYIIGYTDGTLPGQTSAGAGDAYLRKYAADGTEVWTRQFGTPSTDWARGVAVDAAGNVYVAGSTWGLLGQSSAGSSDAFVRKYDPAGTVLWTRQFGTGDADEGLAVALDAAGNAYIAGTTRGVFVGQPAAGDTDAFVSKLDASGALVWTRQFGTAAAEDVTAVAADPDGNVAVSGATTGTFPVQSNSGQNPFVRRYDPAGNETWTRQFGPPANGGAAYVAADAAGNVYASGSIGPALPGQTPSGGGDMYVRKYDAAGNIVWTRQFGTDKDDTAAGVAVDAAGNVYATGFTPGTLGQAGAGGYDAFVRKYGPAGDVAWTSQFGTPGFDVSLGVALDAANNVFVTGRTTGAFPGQVMTGIEDRFIVKLTQGPPPATVYDVTTTADVVDPGDGVLSLREAVIAANAAPGPGTINLPAGTYVLTRAGAGEDAALTGDLDVTDTLTILGSPSGAGAAATVIDGNLADRVFDLRSGALTLARLTVRNGRVAGAGAQGGGIRSAGGLALIDCAVTGNQVRGADGPDIGSSAAGGGIYQSGGALTLTDCTVSDNLAAGGASSGSTTRVIGGGFANGGGITAVGATVTVANGTVTGNRAAGGPGSNASGTAIGGTAEGGGLFVVPSGVGSAAEVPGTLILVNSVLSGNTAEGGPASSASVAIGGPSDGGGAAVSGGADGRGGVDVRGSTVWGNRSVGGRADGTTEAYGGETSGGGLRFSGGTVSNSTVSGNQALGGAADSAPASPYGRTGNAQGGGLAGDAGLVTNNTVTGNAALAGPGNRTAGTGSGGGYAPPRMPSGPGATFRSTILAGNAASTSSPDVARPASAVATSLGNNLVGDATGAPGFADGVNGDQAGGAGRPVLDARLGTLANNGGPTPTHALLPGSPAVNRGSNVAGLAADQRGTGFARVVGAGPDVGAVESPFTPPTAAVGALPEVRAAGGTSYTFTVTYTDDAAIDVATLGTGDVRVTGPNGFSAPAAFVGVDNPANGSPRTATYRLTPPGGAWDATGAGTYTVALEPLQVADTAGGLAAPATLGTFRVVLPTTFLVSNANDSGPGSLRAAIAQANAFAPTADTIAFDTAFFSVPRTITLTSGQIAIADALTITGPGAALLTVSGNSAGRIFFASASAGSLALSGLTLANGRNTDVSALSGGGAILVGNVNLSLADLVVRDCDGGTFGGGVYALNPVGRLSVVRSTFQNDSAATGGGLYAQGVADLVIDTCTFDGDRAVNGGGGGLVVNNSASLSPLGNLALRNSTFSRNVAANGGGGAIELRSPASLRITNSTISGNTCNVAWAGYGGGVGVFEIRSSGSVVIENSTITANTAGAPSGGGGVYVDPTSAVPITVTSSIIAANTAQSAANLRAGAVTLTSSAVGSPDGFTPTPASGNNLPFGTDVRLGPLADNGGPTKTHALLAGSPAIDRGANPAGLAFDQRGPGFARADGAADIGAFEVQRLAHVQSMVVNAGAAQRSRVTELTVTFDRTVTLPADLATAFRLVRTGPGGPVGAVTLAVDLSGSTAAQTVARLLFAGPLTEFGSLTDGNYTLTVLAGQVSGGGQRLDGDGDGVAGGDFVATLHRLFGDANGDRKVDAADLFVFAGAFGRRRGEAGYLDYFDDNGDGVLDMLDLLAVAGNFGKTLP